MFEKIDTKKAPAAIGPYSQGIIHGDLLFTSGQIPIDPATGEIKGENIEDQSQQVMKNIGEILKEAGTGFEAVIKTTCFLKNIEDFAAFNKIYEKSFVSKPARSCVEVARLPKDVLCEVEVIARVHR